MITAVIATLVVLLLLAAFRLWLTANRLDRLHVRTQAAWGALEGALARRIVATRALTATGRLPADQARTLHLLADQADAAPRAEREVIETALSRALAEVTLDGQGELAAELSDAAERVLLARRFYNDAVRDTRGLRASWFTRFFRLAGRAALPDYFELPEGEADPVRRMAGRVVLLDEDGRVLLIHAAEPGDGPCWFTPGGALRPGEDLVTATLRELSAQAGLVLAPRALIGPIWRRTAGLDSPADTDQTEFFFVALTAAATDPLDSTDTADVARTLGPTDTAATADPRSSTTAAARVDGAGSAALDRQFALEHRWFDGRELAECGAKVYPALLTSRLAQAQRIAVTRVAPDIPEPID